MGYRSYRRRSGNLARRNTARQQRQQRIPANELLEVILVGFALFFRSIFRGLRWWYRLGSGKGLPPPLPTEAIPPIPVYRAPTDNGVPRPIPAKPPPLPEPEPLPTSSEGHDAAVARIAAQLPYRSTKCILSQGERAFWQPLKLAVGERYLIACKVRLADLAAAPDDRADSGRRFRDIGEFHLDFVLCDMQTTRPLLVIELDDRSHNSMRSRHRDRFKDAVLKACGLPIYRVRCQQAYAPTLLFAEIKRRISSPGR